MWILHVKKQEIMHQKLRLNPVWERSQGKNVDLIAFVVFGCFAGNLWICLSSTTESLGDDFYEINLIAWFLGKVIYVNYVIYHF